MERDDLKIIKKKYGENMMHLCRKLFSTILDNHPGVLAEIMLETFESNHYLYNDIVSNSLETAFKDYIYNIYSKLIYVEEDVKKEVDDPVTLMRRAGYTLYECQTEQEVQEFKKYYEPGEELCTFTYGGRLRSCYVYFAVKDNVDEIKRADFLKPDRQDEYGTSVISIQFTRDNMHMLSIKNRYNHTVSNPDATFGNNLDNIIPGLTQSFEEYYGMKQNCLIPITLDIPGYVRNNEGKYYKYNYEINNIYYCPNNVIIDCFNTNVYPKEKYLVADYFVIDLVNKKIISYTDDTFPSTIGEIKSIEIKNDNERKIVKIMPEEGEEIEIILDKLNRIIGLKNNNVRTISQGFMKYNRILKELSLEKVVTIGSDFLPENCLVRELSLPQAMVIGDNFMMNSRISNIYIPHVKLIGDNFMKLNCFLMKIDIPEVKKIGNNFLEHSSALKQISLPNVLEIGNQFLQGNNLLQKLSLPNVLKIGDYCLFLNTLLSEIDLPKVQDVGNYFATRANKISLINLPEAKKIGTNFFGANNSINTLLLPNVEIVGERFLMKNDVVQEVYAPKLMCNVDNRYVSMLLNQKKYLLQRKYK